MHVIIDDSSTVVYDDYYKARKRCRSPSPKEESESECECSDDEFEYIAAESKPEKPEPVVPTCIPVPKQPELLCYPNQPAWGMPYACGPSYYNNTPLMCTPANYAQYYYPTGHPVTCNTPALPGAEPKLEPALKKEEPPAIVKDKPKRKPYAGRSRVQVLEDDRQAAVREKVNKYDPAKPANADATQLFWVVDLEGNTVLRNFKTIDEELQPGKWERDNRYGNLYFVQEAKKEK